MSISSVTVFRPPLQVLTEAQNPVNTNVTSLRGLRPGQVLIGRATPAYQAKSVATNAEAVQRELLLAGSGGTPDNSLDARNLCRLFRARDHSSLSIATAFGNDQPLGVDHGV